MSYIPTPSHSEDSISVMPDSGDCIVGDLQSTEVLDGYENGALQADRNRIAEHHPKRLLYAHRPEKRGGITESESVLGHRLTPYREACLLGIPTLFIYPLIWMARIARSRRRRRRIWGSMGRIRRGDGK